jgi:16S rRNA (cytosine967-C5)-methyltransferase
LRFPGRAAAAIEVLNDVITRHRPAAEALKDWGKAHRFAGSTDRHAIGTLVYDSLRNRASAGHAMKGHDARAIVLGTLKTVWALPVAEIAALADDQHGIGALSAAEQTALVADVVQGSEAVEGNFPEWLLPSLRQQFGDGVVAQMKALAARAPIDLRVNSLKSDRASVLEALQRHGAVEGPLVATSVRIAAPGTDDKHANVEVEPAHGMGWFEVQDTASQIAAALSGVKPGDAVLDLCAGAGGKTLALAALMNNQGKLVAHDRDRHRLRPIFERITRSGASIIEVVSADQKDKLNHAGGYDCVVIDAPCSGSGAWRRKPESKWKLTPKLLDQRIADQKAVLEQGATLVKPGGTLVYITCSILPQENKSQVAGILGSHGNFRIAPYAEQWRKTIGGLPPDSPAGDCLLLTPFNNDTDGFFVAVMRKSG